MIEQQKNAHVWEWGSVIVTIIIIVVAGVYYKHFYHAPLKVERHEVSADTLPERFPANIPLEAGTGLIQNYTASAPGVPFQATREFSTHRTIAENFAIYKTFFSNFGWELVSATSSSYATVLASNTTLNLQASVLITDPGNERTVNITVTSLRSAPSNTASSTTTQ